MPKILNETQFFSYLLGLPDSTSEAALPKAIGKFLQTSPEPTELPSRSLRWCYSGDGDCDGVKNPTISQYKLFEELTKDDVAWFDVLVNGVKGVHQPKAILHAPIYR